MRRPYLFSALVGSPIKCTACMLIGVQTGQICGFITPPGGDQLAGTQFGTSVSGEKDRGLHRSQLPRCFSCSGGGGALFFSQSSRSKKNGGSLANIPQLSTLNLFPTPGGAARSTNIEAKHNVLAAGASREL